MAGLGTGTGPGSGGGPGSGSGFGVHPEHVFGSELESELRIGLGSGVGSGRGSGSGFGMWPGHEPESEMGPGLGELGPEEGLGRGSGSGCGDVENGASHSHGDDGVRRHTGGGEGEGDRGQGDGGGGGGGSGGGEGGSGLRAGLGSGTELEVGAGPGRGFGEGLWSRAEPVLGLERATGLGLGTGLGIGAGSGIWVGGSSGGSTRREAPQRRTARRRKCARERGQAARAADDRVAAAGLSHGCPDIASAPHVGAAAAARCDADVHALPQHGGPEDAAALRNRSPAGTGDLQDNGAGIGLGLEPGPGRALGTGLGVGEWSGQGPESGTGLGGGDEEAGMEISAGGGNAQSCTTQRGASPVRAQGQKRRGALEEDDGAWQQCAVGAYRVGAGRVVTGTRVIRLAEVVAGRRRTSKKRNLGDSSGPVSQIRNRMLQADVTSPKNMSDITGTNNDTAGNNNGKGSVGDEGSVEATCGGSLLAGERGRVIRWCEEMEAGKTERRRGYVCGAAWDEGNMIQAMARLKNPTIAWRYGDG